MIIGIKMKIKEGKFDIIIIYLIVKSLVIFNHCKSEFEPPSREILFTHSN